MGNTFTDLFSGCYDKTEARILMVGLDSVGKTTILYKLKMEVGTAIQTTIGFNLEAVRHNGVTLNIWDVGGHVKIHHLWRHYFQNTQGLIFVVDSSDRDRIDEARQELLAMMSKAELRDTILIILANKQDLPNTMNAAEVTDKLELDSLKYHTWHLQTTCAISGYGLFEGLDWLSSQLIKRAH